MMSFSCGRRRCRRLLPSFCPAGHFVRASIVWVVRDAYLRGIAWYIWAVVALVPVLGLAYCLLRPPLLQLDRDEQELEIALKQRQLMKYGECANCGYPVEADLSCARTATRS
ncbi:MAG: hypothetical protein ACLSDQ_04815 [Adlercreutzia equolifaciens]